jgi:hypothetical protein
VSWFTDALKRGEIKVWLGLLYIVAGFVYLFIKFDVTGFIAIESFGIPYFLMITVADHKIDMATIAKEGKDKTE